MQAWFESWASRSVFTVGNGRSSLKAWYSGALDVEESFSGALDSDVHMFVAGVVKSFDTVDGLHSMPLWASWLVSSCLLSVLCACSS